MSSSSILHSSIIGLAIDIQECSQIKLRFVLFLLRRGGVKLLVQEPVDDGGHSLRGVEVQVVATLELPVHEVRVVFLEHALDAGVDLVRHVARALGRLDD